MRHTIVRRVVAAACLAALGLVWLPDRSTVLAAGPDVWAITNARIVTVSGPAIPSGTIVVRDGLIERVGTGFAPPPDARVMDGTGLTVYPGLIDAFAFVEEERDPPSGRQTPARLAERDKPDGFFPARDALDLVRPETRYETLRTAGVTAQLVVPKGGVFRGRSALVATSGPSVSAMAIKSPVALHIAFEPQGGFGLYPSSVMGVVAVVRQKLLDAGHHKVAADRYAESPRGMRRPEPSEALDAIAPVLERRLPVVLEANGAGEMRRALRLAEEFKLDAVVAGGLESWKVAADLKARNVPVLLSLNFPERPADVDAETRESLRTLRERADAPATASKLHAAGVRFAFQSGGLKSPSKIRDNAIRAVKAGLPRDVAIAALTLRPAEILGVGRQLGSLEAGKIANLLVTNGDLFDEKSKIRFVFVDGERYEIKTPVVKATETAAVDLTGTWTLTVSTPEGPQQVTVVFDQKGSSVTGTLTHPVLGSAEVRSGVVSGRRVNFSVSLAVGGATVEAVFAGTVEGDAMSGMVTIPGQGTVDFNGTRPPKP
jgi:imidazolonepropionase-like amidohydrolase